MEMLFSSLIAGRNIESKGFACWSGHVRLSKCFRAVTRYPCCTRRSYGFLVGCTDISEVAHYTPEKSLYEQECIVISPLTTLGWGVGPGGEALSVYPFFVVGVPHLISSGGFII